MILQEQSDESFSQHFTLKMDVSAPCVGQTIDSNGADLQTHINKNDDYFIVKVRLLLSCIVESPPIALLLKYLKK